MVVCFAWLCRWAGGWGVLSLPCLPLSSFPMSEGASLAPALFWVVSLSLSWCLVSAGPLLSLGVPFLRLGFAWFGRWYLHVLAGF